MLLLERVLFIIIDAERGTKTFKKTKTDSDISPLVFDTDLPSPVIAPGDDGDGDGDL